MQEHLQAIRNNVASVLVGQEAVTDLLLTALLAGGHVLMEDVPGMGKTVMARTLARSVAAEFGRVQFTPVLRAVNYSVRVGGKRLRPLILVESNLFCGGKGLDDPLVCAFAAALEMIHTYSLVHDDLPAMDDDMYRRGELTTHAKYGEAMGILAGDALLNFAFETAAGALCKETEKERLLAGARALFLLAGKSGVRGMLGGQAVDVEKTGCGINGQELDFIYRLKTGALIEAAFAVGAVLAGAPQEEVAALSEAAACTGMAFQIQDDILDVTGDEKELGKPVHSDEKNQKMTYVALYSIKEARAQVKSLSEKAVGILDGLRGDGTFLRALILALSGRKY